ncbi:flagellar biosynthetic protein FliO [Hoeflea alexandrii]|uniref:Flagellar biosynthesis protein FliO n=2 Tax=Hoeflea alexandrii TaxID=288436 RepID=A0ABT1CP65_9HYPH|nr:flagellar biosynthetic protein FliO [Hoeflea alexandrii]MCO6407923.1 hypothetical protein [Hoeflea alexandrii]
MPDNLLGGQGATLLTAIIIVAVALLALVGVFWLIRNRAASTFIRGGKNRQPRLAVLDATAVDTRRRLVLIRRDDVEHLVMIGGPTDIVIESRITPHDDIQSAQAAQPRQQRAAPPAPEPARPARAAAPVQAAPQPPERQARSADTAAPTPPQARQQPVSAPLAAASAGAAAAPADSARSEAADLLETARNRVFEEPSFEDAGLDEDLSAAPKPAPAAQARQQPAPASRPEVSQAASPGARLGAGPGAAAADPIQAKAVDVLDTVRTRVFEEPSFDESAFDELTSAPQPDPARATRPPPSAPVAPAASAPAAALAATGSGMATSRPAPAAEQPAAASSDFETVLAAELSQDLTIEPAQDSLITAHYSEHQLDPEEAELLEAPEVQPETQESRDSLEAEMERLLGDLSRKT